MTEAFDGALYGASARDAGAVVALCPATGQACPAGEHLSALYAPPANIDLLNELSPEDNRLVAMNARNLQIKATELQVQTGLRGCDGVGEDGSCPVRNAMDADPIRRTAVKGIRGILKHIRS
jgi:hypothetical protein